MASTSRCPTPRQSQGCLPRPTGLQRALGPLRGAASMGEGGMQGEGWEQDGEGRAGQVAGPSGVHYQSLGTILIPYSSTAALFSSSPLQVRSLKCPR